MSEITTNIVATVAFKALISKGDEIAFKQVFDTYQARIFNYFNKIVKSKEVSEELVIDLFMKIWNNKELIEEVQNIDAFLYRMAVNKALDFLRTAAKEKKLRQLLAIQMQLKEELPAADADYIYKEYERELLLSIKQLPPQQQLAFKLSRENGLSHQQIALELNISKNTVKNHIIAAVKRLKGSFKVFLFFF